MIKQIGHGIFKNIIAKGEKRREKKKTKFWFKIKENNVTHANLMGHENKMSYLQICQQ